MSKQQWVPVEDGFSRVEEQFEGRHTERVSMAQDWLTVGWRPESGEEYKASVQLPDNLRLCRLVEVDAGATVQMTPERMEAINILVYIASRPIYTNGGIAEYMAKQVEIVRTMLAEVAGEDTNNDHA
jgi:hypothetical protein